jgi:tRNA nucleotidyltransferase/poly(A) polymerase
MQLLGTDSHDIDIAIDDMLGKEFCKKVNEYLESIGEETQGVGIIQSNPEQSKHLETARMRIRGVWVDFVNLRAETYAQHSRIPTMEFGTALEDALRRDLTINSLFYNINTCSVEDLTGKGTCTSPLCRNKSQNLSNVWWII